MAENVDPQMTPMQKAHAAAKIQPTMRKNRERPSVYAASRKLALMNFDPLEKLVKLYERIQGEIQWMERLKDATLITKDGTTHKYSKMAHHALLAQQQKLLNDLMRYGYARVPETVHIETSELPSPIINLTPKSPSLTVSKETVLTNIVDGEVVNKVT